jgi:hypothetical protein
MQSKKRMNRNCSGSDEELAVRWTSQNRHGVKKGVGDIVLPEELFACQRCLLGGHSSKRSQLFFFFPSAQDQKT